MLRYTMEAQETCKFLVCNYDDCMWYLASMCLVPRMVKRCQGLSCRVWLPYLNPIFWTVYGLIESQVDNLSALVTLTTQQQVPVYEAVDLLFGYQ